MPKPLDEMDATEIEREIAERKGWRYVVISHQYYVAQDKTLGEGVPIYGYVLNGGISYPPDWPASIAAAWELVEDAQAEPDRRYFEITKTIVVSSMWHAYIGGNYYSDPSAPLAICKAWLTWKRSEDK